MHPSLNALEPRVAGQLGLVTWNQLRSESLSEREISGLVRRRVIVRVRPRVYRIVGSPQTWEQVLLAVVLSTGDGAASHSSAARLWNFRHYTDDYLEVVLPRQQQLRLRGVRAHRSVVLFPTDLCTRHSVRCTSFERTLCDMTTNLSWLQVGRVLDDGLRRKVASLDRLGECLERLDSGPNRRLTVVQGLLKRRDSGFDPGGSDDELRMLRVLREAGLPEPVQQYRVRVKGRTYFLDFAWPDFKVFAEWYGLSWHVGASAVAYDNARITAMSTIGWRPLIFTGDSSNTTIASDTRELLSQVGYLTHRRGA
ncbi:MAG: hypothetical protein ACT4OX_12125 [Actinomycetota bacterium]